MQYASIGRLLTSYVENVDSRLQVLRKQPVWDAWVRLIGASMKLKSAAADKLCVPVAGGGYLTTGRDFSDQSRHDDFEGQEERSPGPRVNVCV